MRGQTGIKKVVLDGMHVSYRVILEDGHEFIDEVEEVTGDLTVIKTGEPRPVSKET